jgi:hypothetical protein
MPRYIASFQPQVYISDDQVIDCHPQGDTEWDVTAQVEADPNLKEDIENELEDYPDNTWEDLTDQLVSEAMPEWAYDWVHTNPFVITVKKVDDATSPNADTAA